MLLIDPSDEFNQITSRRLSNFAKYTFCSDKLTDKLFKTGLNPIAVLHISESVDETFLITVVSTPIIMSYII